MILRKVINLYIILSFVICVHISSQVKLQKNTLRDIYKRGTIKLKKVIKITPDSFPENVLAKSIVSLVQQQDRLYVLDLRTCDIKVLDLNGSFIKSFGVRGKGPGDLLSPFLMCLSDGQLVVWEIGNRRFSFFSPDGKFKKNEKPKIKGHLMDMKALYDGRFVLEIEKIEAIKDKKEIFEWRVLELYSHNFRHIKTLYRQRENQYKYFVDKKYKQLKLPYRPKLSWDVLHGKMLIVGFSDRYEINIIDINSDSKKIISRLYSPVKITENDKKYYLASYLTNKSGKIKKGANKFVRDNIEFPRFKPAFKKLIVDKEGHILVFPFSSADQGKSDYSATSFDVFDEGGIFLNHVKIEDNKSLSLLSVISVSGNEFWCFETEDEYDVVLVKYKVM